MPPVIGIHQSSDSEEVSTTHYLRRVKCIPHTGDLSKVYGIDVQPIPAILETLALVISTQVDTRLDYAIVAGRIVSDPQCLSLIHRETCVIVPVPDIEPFAPGRIPTVCA